MSEGNLPWLLTSDNLDWKGTEGGGGYIGLNCPHQTPVCMWGNHSTYLTFHPSSQIEGKPKEILRLQK